VRTDRQLLATAAALLLAGCAAGPSYERPEAVTQTAAWRDSSAALRDSSYANLTWWQVLGDTTLQQLIRVALQENRDLRVALGRVNEARALLGVQQLQYLPQIDLTGRVRTGEAGDSLVGLAGPNGFNSLAIGLSWEIDLWGRVRRLNESARATLLASEQGRRGAIMTVVSEVARAYLELRDLDAQVVIAGQQVEIRKRSLELARSRFAGGLTSELDVRQGEIALAGVEGTQARLTRFRNAKENELSVLLGRAPGVIPRGDSLRAHTVPEMIPAGLPSQLLERRPDVRQAEEQLHAANAQIGVAVASRFPTISLTAVGGTASTELDGLFSGDASFWNLGANLVLPLINPGRSQKQIAIERARTEAAIGVYEKTVLTAFQEVEDGLVAVQQLRIEEAAAGRAALAARQSVQLATLRYEGGVDNYLNLLDAQRSLLEAELAESATMREHRVALVRLYKALGGGWDPTTDSLAVPKPKKPAADSAATQR
jgi:multidrug efflux system outer membrane protein